MSQSCRRNNLLLLLASLGLGFGLVEVGVRLLISSSEDGYGRVLGVELPPLRVFRHSVLPLEWSSEAAGRLFEDGPITFGDLYGHVREDPALGYTARENAISANGWWQSNGVGARRKHEVLGDASGPRLLVFGESFAHASRVRQEHAWASVLDSLCPEIEVVNFGVDGYSMAQSYLRYRALGPKLEHDNVLFMFVPSVDLWRDLNTLRSLRGWSDLPVVPRFVLDNGSLRLIESPYRSLAEAVRGNQGGISRRLQDHLNRYDRFYCSPMYDVPPLLGELMLYKITAVAWCRVKLARLEAELLKPESEAVRLTRAMFAALRLEAEENGRRFVLVLLPTRSDLNKLGRDEGHAETLSELGRLFCSENECMDLTEPLATLPLEQVDRGADGTHYGPATNRRIAEILASRFACSGRVEKG